MQKYILLVVAIIAAVSILPSCRRATHNGKIDGLWRVEEIEKFNSQSGESEVVTPENLFIAVQLELFQICTPWPYMSGEMTFDNDNKLSVRFTGDFNDAEFWNYGVPSNPVTFTIETLNSKRMILRTDRSLISCRRF